VKVRTKFTTWIALNSFLAALLFSLAVYHEIIEEPEKLIKRELLDISNAVLTATEIKEGGFYFAASLTDYPLERYYIRLSKESGGIIYASPLTQSVDIPLLQDDGFGSVERKIDLQDIWLDPLESDDFDEIKGDTVKFKVLQLTSKKGSEAISLIIAKPLALYTAELDELLHEMLIIIIVTTMGIVAISYFLAGKLLEPIGTINRKIKSIRENSLDERIPLGKSKDELYTLSLSLNAMFDRLQHSFTKQKEFISSAAHEMKIPLAIVMLSQEEILSRNLSEDMYRELSRQMVNLHRLNKLVKDLLDISQLEHKEFIERNAVNLPVIIEKVLEDFDLLLLAGKIQCTTNIERINVLGDKDKLVRVFINLIDNAIKYNIKSSGHITISAAKENEQAKIIIENSGKEIPAEDLPYIFEQFYRVEKSRAVEYGGTGLGLTIVKRIIELHGGTISVESKSGITTITFYLPIA